MDISSINNLSAQIGAPAQPAGQDQRGLVQAVRAVNAAELFGQDYELSFVLGRKTRGAIVRIVKRETGEVVAQIPADYVLRLAETESRGRRDPRAFPADHENMVDHSPAHAVARPHSGKRDPARPGRALRVHADSSARGKREAGRSAT